MFCLLQDPESQRYRYKDMDIKKIYYTYFKNSLIESHVEKKINVHTKTHIQTYKEILRKNSLLKRDAHIDCKMQRHNILLIEELNSTWILSTAMLLHLNIQTL